MNSPDISLSSIRKARAALEGRIIRTPLIPIRQQPLAGVIGDDVSAWIKLELFQHAGSFKARGNLLGRR